MTATPEPERPVPASDRGAGLRALFEPRGVAVIGASRDPAKLGAVMARSLSRFPGPVAGVNPRDVDPTAHRYAGVAQAREALDAPLDLAVLCIPAGGTAQALSDAAAGGVRAALVCSGGFAEAGPEGTGHQEELLAQAQAHGITLLGPNTSGFIHPRLGLTASFVPGAGSVPAGPVAVVAASGGVNHALAFLLAESGVGVSLAVGLGNAAGVTAADVLDHLVDDPYTRAVALHVESVPDGPALTATVRRLTERIPVVALVVGRNDVADFARSHTGALATSWRVTRAALRQAGAVLVDDERRLVDAVTALSAVRLPAGSRPGVAIVTGQAGPGLLHVDGLRGYGIDVPELHERTKGRLSELLPPMTYQSNPVDTGRPGPTFTDVIDTVADDPGIDLVSVYALAEPDSLDLPAALAAARPFPIVAASAGPPDQVAGIRRSLHRDGIPMVTTPSGLTAAVRALVEDAQGRARAARSRSFDQVSPHPATVTRILAGQPLDEDQAKTLLGLLGVPTPPRRACADRAQARTALDELPGPVAIKLLDAAVLHKTEIGGVVLGVQNDADLERALDRLEAAGANRFLVESMAAAGIDLIVGATRDPVFGPVVLVGLGGVVAEALADVATAPAPLSAADAADLLGELSAAALLDGFRGGPAVNRGAVGRILATLGDLLVAHPRLESIEINPLRVTPQGLVALDAVVTHH
jgi:acetate---CoA ligase (ADP-forming)